MEAFFVIILVKVRKKRRQYSNIRPKDQYQFAGRLINRRASIPKALNRESTPMSAN